MDLLQNGYRGQAASMEITDTESSIQSRRLDLSVPSIMNMERFRKPCKNPSSLTGGNISSSLKCAIICSTEKQKGAYTNS